MKDLQKLNKGSSIHIDKKDITNGKSLLTVTNDGPGMTVEQLHQTLFGLGFSTKSANDRLVGQFGQGLNSSVAFFGGECTVFSRLGKNFQFVTRENQLTLFC
jgi:sensor histidine kinase regulating citrate/malate metabolism